jgi:hypothetical protein
MKQDLALQLMGEIMNWSNEESRQEYKWLRLLSRIKYDSYRDFSAGALFVECLADWLQQFTPDERRTAYTFVRENLIFISPAEINHLIELFYPDVVREQLFDIVSSDTGIPRHLTWCDNAARTRFQQLLRGTLFLGLSDGARMDVLRRANTGVISNEQVLIATELDDAKWDSLLSNLRRDRQDQTACFELIYLIDDFVGSGKTFLRKNAEGIWDGKLIKFHKRAVQLAASHFAPSYKVLVHHYIASYDAHTSIPIAEQQARADHATGWFPNVTFTFGTVLPSSVRVTHATHADFMQIIAKYYDSSIESSHTQVGGADVRLGFGACALPLVLEHNTPNNSVALLWADTDGSNGQHAMRPLFRRRQRHV